ncbi:8673_t:CDS:2, partial [Paraglomus brasilianum]
MPPTWRLAIYISLAVFTFFYLTLTVTFFYIRRHKIDDFKYRPLRLNLLSAFATIMLCVMYCLRTAFYPNDYPCLLIHWPVHIGYCLWCSAIACRALSFVWTARFNLAKLQMNTVYRNNAYEGTVATLRDGKKRAIGGSKMYRLDVSDKEEEPLILKRVRKWRHAATDKWLAERIIYPVVAFSIAMALIVQAFSPELGFKAVHTVCPTTTISSVPITTVIVTFLLIICPFLCYLLHDIRDAFGLKRELYIAMVCGAAACVGYFVLEKVATAVREYFGSFMFSWIFFMLWHTISITTPLVRSFKKKETVELKPDASSKYRNFVAVLEDPDLFPLYKECVAACFCTELIVFLEEYQVLKSLVVQACNSTHQPTPLSPVAIKEKKSLSFADIPRRAEPAHNLVQTPCTVSITDTVPDLSKIPISQELYEEYMRFYYMFFDQDSELAINIHGPTLAEAKAIVGAGRFEITMFEKSRHEVFELLYWNTYDAFLRMFGDEITE